MHPVTQPPIQAQAGLREPSISLREGAGLLGGFDEKHSASKLCQSQRRCVQNGPRTWDAKPATTGEHERLSKDLVLLD